MRERRNSRSRQRTCGLFIKLKMVIVWMAVILLCSTSLFMRPVVVRADQEGMVSIAGLELGDMVEIYRIASYSESTDEYVWEGAIADWIANKPTGRAYTGLTPQMLAQMTEDKSKEFCEVALSSLKNDSRGVANLEGYTLLIDQEEGAYRLDVKKGYYVILPKGIQRIYEVKWFSLETGETSFINYEETDYQLPTIASSVTNLTEDRGNEREHPFCLAQDRLKISAQVGLPIYPKSYATGKRILNTTMVIPRGLSLVKDSIQLSLEDDNQYSLSEYRNSIIYKTEGGSKLFFDAGGGYFYEMNGNPLLMAETAEEALEAYNQLHGSGYRLPEGKKTAISSISERPEQNRTEYSTETEAFIGQEDAQGTETEAAETEATETEAAETEAIETEAIETEATETEATEQTIMENINSDAGDGLTLLADTRQTVLILSLDTELAQNELSLEYEVVKNYDATETGFYENEVLLSYSVSPLDVNRIYTIKSTATVSAYGIQLVLCEGTGESISMTAEEKLRDSIRLTGASFYLYTLRKTYDGDKTDELEEPEAEPDSFDSENEEIQETDTTELSESIGTNLTYGDRIIRIYNKDKDTTDEYEFSLAMYPDQYGEVSIGGLEKKQYLLMQILYPEGYSRSLGSISIGTTDWNNDAMMEGLNQMKLIWLDYETVYLVGTGKTGIVPYAIAGISISGFALLIMVNHYFQFSLVRVVGGWNKGIRNNIKKKIARFLKK